MLDIIRGTTQKPMSSEQLVDLLEAEYSNIEGTLYIGYPIVTTSGSASIDALLVSREKGLIIFNLFEGDQIDNKYDVVQDDSANHLEAKLRKNRNLMEGRKLLAEPAVITFAPVADINDKAIDGYHLCNPTTLSGVINDFSWENGHLLEKVLSVIQSVSTIRKKDQRQAVNNPNSRGAKLKNLEDSIANLDRIQGRAVIETVEGVQRIRGLAGSGKTIVLALKAAYLHTQNPNWRIAVTFNTRSLKQQLRRHINTFVIEQSGEEPDWSNISIINAWGSSGGLEKTGIYYEFVREHKLVYYDFHSARSRYGYEGAFAGICQEALSAASKEIPLYDAILVDEAQDFAPPFLQICYSLLSAQKRLVYAYDELQSLNNASLPPPDELFGQNSDGSPRVSFNEQDSKQAQQDIILQKCYRNSRPVLATAHALGFGINRQPDRHTGTGLIQMFDQSALWKEVGYQIEDGELADDKDVVLSRSDETSPKFLEKHSEIDDLIQFVKFDSADDQAKWLAEQIQLNITKDELNADDIIVINPDPRTTREKVGAPRKYLFDKEIESHLVGVDTSADSFFQPQKKSVAFTGIFRAKGNEAGMVYVMNAQSCAEQTISLSRVRNQLFTAITRSKSWVRICGVGEGMQILIDEYESLKNNDFKLSFRYPSAQIRKRLNIINRDMPPQEEKKTKETDRLLTKIIEDISSGQVRRENLSDEKIEMLRNLIDDADRNE